MNVDELSSKIIYVKIILDNVEISAGKTADNVNTLENVKE